MKNHPENNGYFVKREAKARNCLEANSVEELTVVISKKIGFITTVKEHLSLTTFNECKFYH